MNKKQFLAILTAVLILLGGFSSIAVADSSIVLDCWVYYNGMQEQNFNALVQEFNNTVGEEQGIFVTHSTKSSVNELDAQLRASAMNEPGADTMPDLFAAYADTTYALRELGVVTDVSPYMAQEQLEQYIPGYIDEGLMGENNQELCILPMAKSTELLLLNQTAWDEFAAATGAKTDELATWEGITRLGKAYFEWTDAKTPDVAGDGQAFYGRDSMANYILIGSMQMGAEIFEVTNGHAALNFDKDIMRRIWDNYYVPYASGWFVSEGRFRSDDIKTGQIIALVGSTSGAAYFPTEITFDDGTTQPIDCGVYMLPNFEGTEPYAVQQGAGFVVSRSTPEKERAAVTFLEWLTMPERNIRYALSSGYLPVTKAAVQPETINEVVEQINPSKLMRQIIEVGRSITADYQLYTNRPFSKGFECRAILEKALQETAANANEKRLQLMADGAAYEEAVAQVVTDEAFERWYEDTKAQLENQLAAQE